MAARDPLDAGSGGARPAHRHKPTFAERRERRAAVEDVGVVLDAAARYLEARPRSEAEVRRRLTDAGYRAELVDAAVGRLRELQYLDDAAFAKAWIESRDRSSPRGEHALRRELGLKGIDRTLADEVLRERRDGATAGSLVVPLDPDDLSDAGSADDRAAERLLRKRLSAILREPDPRRRRQRAYGLLARSGFAPDVCSAVSRRVLEDDDAGTGDEPAP